MSPKLNMFSKHKHKHKDSNEDNYNYNYNTTTIDPRKSTSTYSTISQPLTTSQPPTISQPPTMSQPTASTSTSSSSNPPQPSSSHTKAHQPEPGTLMESVLESTSIKVTDTTINAIKNIDFQAIIDTYITPVIRYFHQLYLQQPPGSVERLGMWGCLVAGAIPVGCLVLGVGMACVGCFIVTGATLLITQ
ncbi:hypothetical protein BG015_011598, partial [Linnemannia schmuckeri]